jgi:hypothetical protein
MDTYQLIEAHKAFELYLSFNNATDKRLVGMFDRQADGSFAVKDIRMSDFSRIEQYKVIDSLGNESEPKRELEICFTPDESFHPQKNCYYYFAWKYTDSNPDNLCEITIDLSKDLEMLTPYDIITLLYNAQMNLAHGSAKTNNQMLDTLTKQLTANDDEVFIYELLQNANDYPYRKGEDVDVEIKLTKNYLLFRHTGAEFSPKNVAALCNANDKDKVANPDTIGYKGIGFKTVFNHNNYVYLTTGGFSFRYDSEIRKKKAGIPWKVTPIWMEKSELDPEYGDIFDKARNRFRVQFAMRPIKHETLWQGDKCFSKILQRLFVDETKILFIPNIGKVDVYLDDESKPTYSCSKKSANWCLSEVFEYQVDEAVTRKINQELKEDEENETSRIPIKYKDFKKTGVSFACKVKGRKLLLQDNAIMYCYLPAELADWGFKFYMNSDMIPDGPRKDIEHGLDLNSYLAENAGRMFYRWIHSLVESGKYDYDSIFALIPNFDTCKNRRPVNKTFVEDFQRGFEACLDLPLIPTESGKNVPIKEIVWDDTYLTSSDIISDEQFFLFTGMNGYLPHSSLRKNEDFRRFVVRYLNQKAKENIWGFNNLKECVTSNEPLQNWLVEADNNGKFLDFLLSSQGERLKEFSKLPIYINNSGELCASNTIYYTGDNVKQALSLIDTFVFYFPHLSLKTIEYFKNQQESRWSKAWPSLGFKQFSAGEFVSKVLFSAENKDEVLSKLKQLEVSVKFINYLAHNAKDNYGDFDLHTLPFVDTNGQVVNSFAGKLVFYEESKGRDKEILKEKWFDPTWAYFINDAYTEHDDDETVWKFLLNKNLVKIFEAATIIKEVLTNNKNLGYIIEHTKGYLPASISFVHYLYQNKHHLLSDSDYKSVPLNVTDLDGKTSFMSPYNVNVFTTVDRRYTNHSWLKCTWIYKLDVAYYTNIPEKDLPEYRKFLTTRFGLKELNDTTFYQWVAKKNRVDIAKLILTDEQKNIAFYKYLAEHQNADYIKRENIGNVFVDLPYINSFGKIKAKRSGKEYQYNSTLDDLVGSTWVTEDSFQVLSAKYNFSGAKDLFKLLGVKEYNDSNFGNFFASELSHYVSLETPEKVSDFHHYMAYRVKQLNEEQLEVLQAKPCYVYGTDGPRSINKSTGLYIPNANLDITKMIAEGLLPLYDAIDKTLCDTPEMISYWITLGNKEFSQYECNRWLKSKKDFFDTKLSDTTENLRFWRWLRSIQESAMSSNLSDLSGFKMILFSERDAQGKEVKATVGCMSDSVYMPNLYHQGIETFANKYGRKTFVSESYATDPSNEEECKSWREFFKKVGVKDDVKDVIRQIIEKDLETLQDENIPAVLAEQFQTEIDSEWNTLSDKLKKLKVKLKNENSFVPISEVVIIDVLDYSSEPMEYIHILKEIAPSYIDNSETKKLIKKIATVAGTKIITNRAQWMHEKVDAYIALQPTVTMEGSLWEIHTKFISDFANVYKRNYPNWGFDDEAGEIKLFDKKGNLMSPSSLTLGHAYNPYCDFEENGIISKAFVHEDYGNYGNIKEVVEFFDQILNVQMVFRKADLELLGNEEFCSYYWKEFLPIHAEAQDELLAWVKDGALEKKYCILNRAGKVCCAESLYSINISNYVEKKINDWESKLPDVPKLQNNKIREILNAMKFNGALCFEDSLDNLLNTKFDDTLRGTVLGWIATSYKEEQKAIVERYRDSEKAIWPNGQQKSAHIKALYAISDSNNKRISTFRTNEHIIDSEKFRYTISKENWFKAIKYLGVVVLSDSDLTPECPIDIDETEEVRKDILLRLLVLISSREGSNWFGVYAHVKNYLSGSRFVKCSSISYKYNELSSDNEKFFYQNDTYYYVKNWQQKQVFTRFVTELNDHIHLNYDIGSINDILDHDEKDTDDIITYLNDNCLDQYDDAKFLIEVERLSSKVKSGLHVVKKVKEPEQVPANDGKIESVSKEVSPEGYNPYEKHTHQAATENQPTHKDDVVDKATPAKEYHKSQEEPVKAPFESTNESYPRHLEVSQNKEPEPPEEYEDVDDDKFEMRLSEEDVFEEDEDDMYENEDDLSDNYVEPKGHQMTGNSNSPYTHQTTTNGYGKKQYTGEYGLHKSSNPNYDPLDEIASSKEKETFETDDAEADERELAHCEELFMNGLSRAEIDDQNILVKTRMFNSFKEEGFELDMSEVQFIRFSGNKREYDVRSKSGKYIHVVSAYRGIMYLSPAFWNRVQRRNCIVCVVLSHKARNFKYIHNREELEKIIGNDELVVKVSGSNKIDLVNELYGKVLHNARRKIYTMVRVKSGTRLDMLFKPARSEWDESEDNNDDL